MLFSLFSHAFGKQRRAACRKCAQEMKCLRKRGQATPDVAITYVCCGAGQLAKCACVGVTTCNVDIKKGTLCQPL